MKRARTLSGLLRQAIQVRWAALGKGTKVLLFASAFIGALVGLQLALCASGGCPCSASRPPCHGGAYMRDAQSPCPYAHRGAMGAAGEPKEAPPPCHAP